MSDSDFAAYFQQFYSAAYESPIEERLAWELSKRLAPGVTLRPQAQFSTVLGRFRADLLLSSPTGQTILECDGHAYHLDVHRDHVRDIALLHASHAMQVLRFRGTDLYRSLPDILMTILTLHPDAFDRRGKAMIVRQASLENVAKTREDFLQSIMTSIGGKRPGQIYRAAIVRRFAPDGPHDPLAEFLVQSFQTEEFRTLADAVEATRELYEQENAQHRDGG